MATKKFSPAQIAAQKLFAERARAGTLKQRKKRKPNPGLYENIDAKRKRIAAGSGEKMRKPGSKGAPTQAAFEQSAMTAKRNPDKTKPRAYVMRASQATGRPPVKGTKAGNRLITRRKKALSAPAGYFPNPSTNRGLAIFLDAIALGETFSESKLIEALDHPSLSVSDRNVIRDALKGRPYSHIRLMDAAMKIRNYKGERKTNPAAAMMTGYQVICMHPKKHVVGIFKTMAEAKMVATAMANAKGVAYGVKAVKVHKTHFAV